MLNSLEIEHFRCIEHAALDFAPDVNLIFGDNASGKTSLLEAIFFLGRARSFRTPRIEPLIQDEADALQVTGTLGTGGQHLGIRRGRRSSEIRLGGATVRSLAELAQAFPVQALDPTVHGLLEDGPRHRRRFLDWGVFHVEQGFQAVWQRYNRALRQRNILLRQDAPRREFIPWEQELTESGGVLDGHRRAYLAQLSEALQPVAVTLLAIDQPVTLEYLGGWPDALTLAEALEAGWSQDMEQGATRSGPHRAEFVIRIGGRRVRERISRGQQKVLAGALVLTQMRLFRAATGLAAVLLADDLPAELDTGHLARFLELAGDGSSQLFMTSIRPESVPASLTDTGRVFHVEQGAFVPSR